MWLRLKEKLLLTIFSFLLGKRLKKIKFLLLTGRLISHCTKLWILRKFSFQVMELGLLPLMMHKFLSYTIHLLEDGVVPWEEVLITLISKRKIWNILETRKSITTGRISLQTKFLMLVFLKSDNRTNSLLNLLLKKLSKT